MTLNDVVLNPKIGTELQSHDKDISHSHHSKHLWHQDARHDQIAAQSNDLRGEMPAQYPHARMDYGFAQG